MRQQLIFTVVMLVVGGLESTLAYCWVGVSAVEGACWSLLLCMTPGWLTIYSSNLLRQRDLGPYVVLVGIAFRIVFVCLGLFVTSNLRPDLGFREFFVWLICGYLAALAVETWLLVSVSESTR